MEQSNTITSYSPPTELPPTIVDSLAIDQPARNSTLCDTLLNSLTISLIAAPWWVATLALVFTGTLAPYLGQAAIFLMAGGLISMTLISMLCSWKGAIWIPQDIPTAILVVSTAEIVRKVAVGTSAETVFITVIVTIGLASILTGTFLYLLGTFRLGGLVRHIPYPVLAGFLGATGCLLLLSGITNSLVDVSGSQLLGFYNVMRWLPAVLLAIIIYTLSLYTKHALLIPALMFAATLCFYGVTASLGISLEELRQGGWLFEALPKTQQSVEISFAQIKNVEWNAILIQSNSLIVLTAVSAVAMLLNNSGFALSVKGNFDQNKDLRVTGIANFLAGLVGGWPGYISLSKTAINARQGKQLPFTGFLIAIFTSCLLWYATQLIEMIPRFVVGSAIAYMGVTFLFKWVVEPAKRLPPLSYFTSLCLMALFVNLGLMM